MFAALADPTRRRAVEELRHGPCRAGELAAHLGTNPAGLSRHLRILRESGLVREEVAADDARARHYHLERDPITAMRHWVDDIEAYWSAQLDSFKQHAEKTRGPARRHKTPPGKGRKNR